MARIKCPNNQAHLVVRAVVNDIPIPFGPEVLYDGASYKKAPGAEKNEKELPGVGEVVTITKASNDMSMKLTYKRVELRK